MWANFRRAYEKKEDEKLANEKKMETNEQKKAKRT